MSTFGRSKGARSASPLRSTSPGNLRRSGSFGKSGRGLAASFDGSSTAAKSKHVRSSTADVGNIENEYIRNLQQQVYFLELETNYLREQARKASVIPPRVTEEADRMMRKLRDLQSQLDERSNDVSRKESKLLMLEAEKDTAVKRLRDVQGSLKIQDDCTALIKENAALAAQVIELQKHIDMDRAHKDEKDVRRSANIQELVSLKESNKQLKHELEKTQDLLRLE
ncbi:uncharacterized protein LOC110247389, partial [Exaiptasia diaphana]|uniref:Uncharacterized protein n=1 Tax=Exaiptasia diaphana TaxID=2652724 RepID=A0A913XUR0_EXADI